MCLVTNSANVATAHTVTHRDSIYRRVALQSLSDSPSYHITAMENTPSVAFSYTHSPVVLAAISSFLILAGTFYTPMESGSKSQIPALGGFSIVNGWNFFVRRCDFLQSNFKKVGQPIFSFKVLQVSLLVRIRHFDSDACPSTK